MVTASSLSALRPEVARLKAQLDRFVEEECIPAEEEYEAHLATRFGQDRWTINAIPPCLERLKMRAKQLGLWNLFIPPHLVDKVPNPSSLAPSVGLSYREYGVLCESMGRCLTITPEACNCSAPDTGNMEVLLEFGTEWQKQQYLLPLLRGDCRSCFLMTEPAVASSDPTNLATSLQKRCVNGKIEYVLNGHKWWSTGAMDPRCKVALVVARMDYSHPSCTRQPASSNKNNRTSHGAHTIVAVPLPHPSVECTRALTVFGYDDAPHGHAEVVLNEIRLTEADLILGEGSGFRVSQARLGPGRIHHCMRAIGMAARCYELMLQRSFERRTFGMYLWEHGGCQELIAEAASDLVAARLMTLSCAAAMDATGAQKARDQIAMIKVTVPKLCYNIIDRAVQIHGGAGLSEDFVLARALAGMRSLRIADGPDAVHQRTLALLEIKKFQSRSTQRPSSRL